jgi:hypothetical protein
MVRKGFVPANTFYAIVLIIIFILLIGQLIYYFLHKETTLEYFLSDIYVARNGMNLANLYLGNSLDFAVYQAMYDNGMRGGWKEIPPGSLYAENLSYWQETGGVITPSAEEINESLRSAITENLNLYVKDGYSFLGKFYTLPTFEAGTMALSSINGSMEVSAGSGNKIRFHDMIEHETGEERIDIESHPKLGNTYPIDYFELYNRSSWVFRKVKSESCDALNESEETTTEDVDFKYTQKVLRKATAGGICQAEVMVNVTLADAEFPVFNGTGVSFEPVGMVFFVKIG